MSTLGNIAVAIIIFNRPLLAKSAVRAVGQYRPKRLYLIADGPRDRPGEAALCEETRANALGCVDWDCELVRIFSDGNLGCRSRVVSGLDSVFSRENRAIIVEDDVLPHASFFMLCERLLDQYQDDDSVFSITGTNVAPIFSPSEKLLLSNFTHIWGWATWRRSWLRYDRNLHCLDNADFHEKLRRLMHSEKEALFWMDLLARLKAGEIDTWDYQLQATAWNLGSKCITPPVNLIANLGFGTAATHTFGDSVYSEMRIGSLDSSRVGSMPLVPSPLYDWWFQRSFHNPGRLVRFFQRVQSRSKKLIRRFFQRRRPNL